MQKSILSICALCATLVLALSSCKDDDDPVVPAKLSINTETVSVSEGGGTAAVEVVLDKAAPADITIEYSLGGTAVSPADYTIVNEGELEIPQGQTSGTIAITIVNDAVYEGNETIEIEIQDVNSTDVEITNDDEAIVTITEDDPQATVSFPTTTMTVKESDNEELLEIQVSLSTAAPQAITIQYEFAHNDQESFAIDDIYAAAQTPVIPEQFVDFEVDGGQPQVVIPQGANSAVIKLQLFSDFLLEDDETINITLTSANGATIGTNNKMTITLAQEDGKAILLVWDDDYTDVDMDMFLWVGETITTFGPNPIATSLNEAVDPQYELVFIPSVVEDAAFGVSYVYYAGTADPMNFESHFIDFVDGDFAEDFDIYPGTYTQANVNKWDQTGAPKPAVVQTFRIEAGAYVEITDIEEPASGSRKAPVTIPAGMMKTKSHLVTPPLRVRSF